MGHNQSSPNFADQLKPSHFPRAFNDRIREHAYEISHTDTNQRSSMKRSSSFIDHVPSREKHMLRDDMLSSYNDCSEARISSTTFKTKRPSTVKSQITSQDRRRSEDFDMGQMEENIEVLKKNPNFSENIQGLDSTTITNDVLSKIKGRSSSQNPKSRSFLLSSCQTSENYHHDLKQEYNAIGPRFFNKANQKLQGKLVDDEAEVMKTENFQSIDLTNKDAYITEASLCRMESIGFADGKFRETKNGDDEVRILETGGSRLSSPRNLLTNRYSPELQPEYSHKKSSIKKDDNRYARPMIASFDDEQIGSHLVKDSDIMSLSSSEPDHGDASFANDEDKNLSPEKTKRGVRSVSRKDGYQEVEFSFKPNSMSKGSRRYTTEDDVLVETNNHFNHEINRNIIIHDPDLDAENPLIKSLNFNSIEFVSLKPSVEEVSRKISPCKSSGNNVLQEINNTLESQENIKQNISEKQISAHNILYDSKELLNHENTKDTSKDSQPRAESPSICYPGAYFQSKTTVGDDQKDLAPNSNPSNLDFLSSVPHISEVAHNDKDIFVEEYFHDEGTKENRPNQTNQNIYKLQQITNSDSKVKKESDPIKSPTEVYSVGRILQNMKKGVKEQLQHSESISSGLIKAKNFYKAQGSMSDKGQSFSKEASAASSSFFRLMKDTEKINKALASQVYTLREDYQSLSGIKRPNLRIEKMGPKLDNYTHESQGSFHIDDSMIRTKRRKSELNNSRVQKKVPAINPNKTLTQETCCISTATSRNEVSMNSMKLTKQASKAEITLEYDQAPRNLHKVTKSVTSSRTSVERNTPLLKKPAKKGIKDYSSTRDSQSSGKETQYTLILPVTSPKEIDTKRIMTGTNDQKRKMSAQQGKLNKTVSRILSEKEEYSQGDRSTKTPTYQKKPWSDRDQMMVRSRSAVNQKKGEAKVCLNETLDLPERVFLRPTTDVQDEKASGSSYNAKVLKNLLRGQMEKPQRKSTVSDRSDQDIRVKVLNRTTIGFKEKSGAKSPFLKKPFEAR